MSGWLRALGTLAYGLLAFLGGCQPPVIAPMYGPAPVEHDPSVEITDFSYTPESNIQAGDTLTFTAQLNQPVQPGDGWITAEIGSELSPLVDYASSSITVWLNDEGGQGDQVPHDGIWTGEHAWLPEYGPQQGLPVSAHMQWADGYIVGPVSAPPLTVLPAVE